LMYCSFINYGYIHTIHFSFLHDLDDETTIHGLETLIEYYQEENRGLVTILRKPYK
jgi:hypothetical protein